MDFKEIDEDYEDRMLQFEMDCNDGKGNPTACQSAAEYFSVVKNDHKKAAKIYKDNCERHNFPPSCFNLGRLILSGKVEELQRTEDARAAFDTACRGQHTKGCHHLALMLLHGIGDVKRDTKKAYKLLDEACLERDSDSCYLLANQLLKPGSEHRAERDPPKARALLEIACDHGHAPSCFNLAVMFKHGDAGVAPDAALHEKYKGTTQALVEQAGGLRLGTRKA